MAALARTLGLEAFPEGAWLRIVAFLSMGDCAALTLASTQTLRATAAATSSLGRATRVADSQLQQRLREIEARQQAAVQRARRERTAATDALAKLAPLQHHSAGLRFPEQMRQILEELEDIAQRRTVQAEEAAVAQRATEEDEVLAEGQAADSVSRLLSPAPAQLLSPEAFPEGAWLRTVALLHLPDCAAVTRASQETRRGTADAMDSLGRATHAADSRFQEHMREIDARQRDAQERAQRERSAADDAIAALAPLRDGVAGARFPEQMQFVLAELGEISQRRTVLAEEGAAAQRAEEEAEARTRRNAAETQARGMVAQGLLQAAEA